MQDCRSAASPLTTAVGSGEHVEELLSPGLIFFAEPTNCRMGQVLAVNVSCSTSGAQKSSSAQPATAVPVDVGAIISTIAPVHAGAPAPAASAAQHAGAPAPSPGSVAAASRLDARSGAVVQAPAVTPALAPATARHAAAPEAALAPAPAAVKHV